MSSLYSECIRIGCYLSFDQFLEAHYWRFHQYMFHQLFYLNIYRCYEGIIGAGRVKMMLFEDFQVNPSSATSELSEYLEIDPFETTMPRTNLDSAAFH